MNRPAALAYGSVCYLLFFGTFLYAIGFLANLVVPKTVDSVAAAGAPGTVEAVLVNLALLGVFAVQHSGMARPAFKRWLTRFVPREIERSTYVLLSSVAMWLLFWGWQPMPELLFTAEGGLRTAILALYAGGVGLVLYSTCLIDHFDLFGLRQVALHFRGRAYAEKNFVTPSLYRFIRHPLYVGWFLVFWVTPDMTVGRLLLASVVTAYILVAIVFEERDLSDLLGAEYRAWRERTPKFLPRFGSGRGAEGARAAGAGA